MFVKPLKNSIYNYWREKTLEVLKPCIKENPDNKLKLNNIQNSLIIKFHGVQYAGELDMECLKKLIHCYKLSKHKYKDHKSFLGCYLEDFFKKFNIHSSSIQSKFTEIIKDVEDKLLSKSFLHNYDNVSRSFNIQNVTNSLFIMFYDIRGPLSDLFINALHQTGNKKKFDNNIAKSVLEPQIYFLEAIGILATIFIMTISLSFIILFGNDIWKILQYN